MVKLQNAVKDSNATSWLMRSKWCLLVAGTMMVLSIMPQLHLWLIRGAEWQGAYTILQGDELLYSTYVNALMDGRPRKTDPPTGEDDHPQSPLPESLFSIQFIPAYVIAGLAKVAGLSAAGAFVALLAVAGLLASLSIYWLLFSLTREKGVAAIGVLVVLCFGALAAGQGLVGLLLKPDVRFLGLPFLRRYEPAAPFPLFFVFCTLIWIALTTNKSRLRTITAVLAGLTLGVLIFSYFFLWTAAAAWFFCVACLWLLLRPQDRSKTVRVILAAALPIAIALAFYVYLLTRLPKEAEAAQVLVFTRWPDLLRVPEIMGALLLIALVAGARSGRFSLRDPQVLFAASLALAPFVIFNQQIVTGRSIQPFHYEVLIANYVVLVGLVIVTRFFHPVVPRRTVILLVTVSLFWGLVEVNLPSPVRSIVDVKNDRMVPVFHRLKDLADSDGTWTSLQRSGTAPALVYSPEYAISRLLPTWAPQGLLLATGSASFQSLPQATRKEWLYMHLYYSGRNSDYVRELLNERIDDPFLTYFAKSTTFGPERVLLFLGWNSQPITQEEIEQEARLYDAFVKSFSQSVARKRPVTYAVTLADGAFDFSRVDLWYDRDDGERVGDYILYRLKLKDESKEPLVSSGF